MVHQTRPTKKEVDVTNDVANGRKATETTRRLESSTVIRGFDRLSAGENSIPVKCASKTETRTKSPRLRDIGTYIYVYIYIRFVLALTKLRRTHIHTHARIPRCFEKAVSPMTQIAVWLMHASRTRGVSTVVQLRRLIRNNGATSGMLIASRPLSAHPLGKPASITMNRVHRDTPQLPGSRK